MLIASSYLFQQSGDVDFEMQSRRVKITPKKEANGEMCLTSLLLQLLCKSTQPALLFFSYSNYIQTSRLIGLRFPQVNNKFLALLVYMLSFLLTHKIFSVTEDATSGGANSSLPVNVERWSRKWSAFTCCGFWEDQRQQYHLKLEVLIKGGGTPL